MGKIHLKKILLYLLLLLLLISNNQVFAVKNQSAQSLIVLGNDGVNIVNGSILNPKQDEVNIALSRQALIKIKKSGLTNLSVNLISAFDSTKTYLVPSSAISIQKKAINKKTGNYLVVSLFSLTTLSYITISPSALPSDNYKLKIVGGSLDITTDTFTYQTPALIVGTVDSKSSGLVSVENLTGETISERTVATNSNGIFFTEVRANKIGSIGKTRTYLKEQTSGNTIDTGVVHAVTSDSDLKAIVPLDNNVDNNAAKADKPIEINEASTLTASLAKENPELANEVGKQQLQNLTSENIETSNSSTASFNDPSCDIEQFASDCKNGKTDDNLAAIGANFKNFLQTASCNFQEFDLIKKTILATPDSANAFIGKGYCEHEDNKEVDSKKPCQIYAQILKKHQSSEDKGLLPCPPQGCTEFANITQDNKDSSKRCAEPSVVKSKKELYCVRIGIDIKPEECKDDETSEFKSGWIIEINSKGNQYCVPTNFLQLPADFTVPPNSKDIAEQCEVNACHKTCTEKFNASPSTVSSIVTQKCEACDCHLNCEAVAAKGIDCGNPRSKYFSNQCCNKSLAAQFLPPGYGNSFGSGSKGGKAAVSKDVKGCLCGQQINNVDEKGFFTDDAINICSHICPSGYEESKSNLNLCVKSCQVGFIRDSIGNCVKKKCPEGTTQDDTGNCKCPEGQTLTESGTCEIVCFDGQKKDSVTGQCVTENKCGEDQHADSTGACICNSDGSVAISSGPEGCKKPNLCGSNMLPNPKASEPNQAKCICPANLPYWDGEKCVLVCVSGNIPATTNTDLLLNSPIPCGLVGARICDVEQSTTKDKCICAGAATPAADTGICKCPTGKTYTQTGCDVPRTCDAGQFSIKDACTCASPSYLNTMTGSCDCPSGYTAAYSAQGCGQLATQKCSPTQVSTLTNPCVCAGTATPTGDGGICKCPSGQTYTAANGCTVTCTEGKILNSATNECKCPGNLVDSSGTCQCASGFEIDPANANNCRAVCNAPKVRNSSGVCSCPSGQDTDPANSSNCVACSACTEGKTFTGSGCACQ